MSYLSECERAILIVTNSDRIHILHSDKEVLHPRVDSHAATIKRQLDTPTVDVLYRITHSQCTHAVRVGYILLKVKRLTAVLDDVAA